MVAPVQSSTRVLPAQPLRALVVILAFTALLWVIELYDAATGGLLDYDGIVPRTTDGLEGIVWAPLLHHGFAHLEGEHPAVHDLRVPGARRGPGPVRTGHSRDLGARRSGGLAYGAGQAR